MTRVELLLTQYAEECNEVAQRVSKALRFGLDEIEPGQPHTNAERIMQETCDQMAVLDMLMDAEALPVTDLHQHLAVKQAKVEKFLAYSKECQRLTE